MADRTLTVTTVGQPDKTLTINRDRFAGVRTMTRQDADGGSSTITIDRSPTGTKYGDKPGQSRPLLDKVVGGAAAAYSLRDLNDAIGSTKVVKVRRDADNEEKDFKAQDVNKIANWVNGKQETVLPADDIPDPSLVTSFTASGAQNVNLNGTFTLNQFGWQKPSGDGYIRYYKELGSQPRWRLWDFDGEESDVTTIGFDDVEYPWQISNWAISNPPTLGTFRTSEGVVSFGEAAAAYSLRKVRSAYSGDAVRVRRASDYVEVNVAFDANGEVSTSSAITNVTDSIFPTSVAQNRTGGAGYDTFTTDGLYSFSAACSSISAGGYIIGEGSSGDIVTVSFDVTLNSTTLAYVALRPALESDSNVSNLSPLIASSGSYSFDLTATDIYSVVAFVSAEGDFTVSNVSIVARSDQGDTTVTTLGEFLTEGGNQDASVVTWYDQSGNSNDATQDTAGNQPKIAEAGALIADGVDLRNSQLNLNSSLSTDNYSAFVVNSGQSASQPYVLKGSLNSPSIRTSSSSVRVESYAPVVFKTFTVSTAGSNQRLDSVFKDSSDDVQVFRNAVVSTSGTQNIGSGAAPFTTLGRLTDSGSIPVAEIIFFESDQSDNRFKIESNINNHYGLYTPAEDGFVNTWYDQSGNGNDAVATADTNEPKIVNAGSLLAGGIDFDGVDDFLRYTGAISSNGQADTTVFVAKLKDNLNTYSFCDNGSNSDPHYIYGTSTHFSAYFGGLIDVEYATVDTNENLHFVQKSTVSSQSFGSLNGTTGALNAGTDGYTGGVIIGAARVLSLYLNGSMKELIIYASDQSANRSAIEDNINNHYELYS